MASDTNWLYGGNQVDESLLMDEPDVPSPVQQSSISNGEKSTQGNSSKSRNSDSQISKNGDFETSNISNGGESEVPNAPLSQNPEIQPVRHAKVRKSKNTESETTRNPNQPQSEISATPESDNSQIKQTRNSDISIARQSDAQQSDNADLQQSINSDSSTRETRFAQISELSKLRKANISRFQASEHSTVHAGKIPHVSDSGNPDTRIAELGTIPTFQQATSTNPGHPDTQKEASPVHEPEMPEQSTRDAKPVTGPSKRDEATPERTPIPESDNPATQPISNSDFQKQELPNIQHGKKSNANDIWGNDDPEEPSTVASATPTSTGNDEDFSAIDIWDSPEDDSSEDDWFTNDPEQPTQEQEPESTEDNQIDWDDETTNKDNGTSAEEEQAQSEEGDPFFAEWPAKPPSYMSEEEDPLDDQADEPVGNHKWLKIAGIALAAILVSGGLLWGGWQGWNVYQSHREYQRQSESDQRYQQQFEKVKNAYVKEKGLAKDLLDTIAKSPVKDDESVSKESSELSKLLDDPTPSDSTKISQAKSALVSQRETTKKAYEAALTGKASSVGESLSNLIGQSDGLSDAPDSAEKSRMQELADKWRNNSVTADNLAEADKDSSELQTLVDTVGKAKEDAIAQQQAQQEAERQAQEQAQQQAQQQSQQQSNSSGNSSGTTKRKSTSTPTYRKRSTGNNSGSGGGTTQAPQQTTPQVQPSTPSTVPSTPSGNTGMNLG